MLTSDDLYSMEWRLRSNHIKFDLLNIFHADTYEVRRYVSYDSQFTPERLAKQIEGRIAGAYHTYAHLSVNVGAGNAVIVGFKLREVS